MIIDKKLNGNYNRLLAEIHGGLNSTCDVKKYRDVMKGYDPDFPKVDGIPISMSVITQEQMANHMNFMRMFSCRRGYAPDDVNKEEFDAFTYEPIVARVLTDIVSEGKDSNICSVVCSSCGCATKRVLSDSRLKDLLDIQLGIKSEQGGSDSFICIECYKEKK